MKTYSDFYKEISADEMYDNMIKYGIFCEKLPPIFDANEFLKYCKDDTNPVFPNTWYPYANYDSIRNINTPRSIGIPVPMAHVNLCKILKKYWENIQLHFEDKTKNQKHIVSRIHVRKMLTTGALFEMNYKNWEDDGTPEPDISMGKKYLVKADVSQCFPSIYSHAISWALVTKKIAKQNVGDDSQWYNELDRVVRNMKNGETHGLLIGPHTSNVLSEIVLSAVDNILCNDWEYVRAIDDFSCYVESKDDAERFIVELHYALKEFGLSLNHKKTQIIELPVGTVENWVRQIQGRAVYLQKFHDYVDYYEVQTFLDFCIELMSNNKDNASVILYGIKILKKHKLTSNAQKYVLKTMISLSLLYSYIVPLLEENIFDCLEVTHADKTKYINIIYDNYLNKEYAEPLSYALYYATKYDVKIEQFDIDMIIQKNDSVLFLCSLIYARHFKLQEIMKTLKNKAKEIRDYGEMNEYWPFTYECLTQGLLSGAWKELKKNDISFLKEEYR
ncbi:RNA-directed DNA polymerase [uncultured Eubacterium sp.]|uniref:RNA-directed DNA polymerase n=1 Tax=uncultured Eubacterium sp. TaxID=165185 RepID=UPI0025948723|nr:RNA-directed DNA polymerase [uncultured Eubacterium sp.]